jgi:protein-S-isoprenylcysteine O-methyltransferase Ste14
LVDEVMSRLFVWLGGALFVISLAVCAYSFTVVWAIPATAVAGGPGRRLVEVDAGWPALAFDTLLFGVFAIHHSIFARERIKTWLARFVPSGLERSVYVCTASLLLIGMCLSWQPVGGDLYRTSGWLALGLGGVQALGIGLVAWAVRAIDPLELAGIRDQSRTGLQTMGPYRLVRHPLYLGFLLAIFGTTHMTADRLSFAVMTLAYLAVAIPWEERALASVFGEEYVRYKRRVRWRLVPYVY